MKLKLAALMIALLAVLSLAACSSSVKRSEETKAETKAETESAETTVAETEPTYALDDDFYGTWYIKSGDDDNTLKIRDNGNVEVIWKEGTNDVKYSVSGDNEITFSLDGKRYELYYDNGELIRYEDGIKDGVVYSKRVPVEETTEEAVTTAKQEASVSVTPPAEPLPPSSTPDKSKSYTVTDQYLTFTVPAGFERKDMAPTSNGSVGYFLYSEDYDMTIYISATDTLIAYGSSDYDWLTDSINLYPKNDRKLTYSLDEYNMFIKSGYMNSNGNVFYDKEIIFDKNTRILVDFQFNYSTQHKSVCDRILTEFLDNAHLR